MKTMQIFAVVSRSFVNSKRRLRLSLFVVVILLATGCQHFTMFTAKDFVVLEDSYPYDFRATTPEGLVMGVREFDNSKQHGELKFWTAAIENELRLDHGYALEKTSEITTLQGKKGTQLRFGLDRDDVAHVYVVTVFATDTRVFVLEAGGTEQLVKKHQAQIDWSISEFRIH